MKPNIETQASLTKSTTFKTACLAMCKKVINRVQQAKNTLLSEYRDLFVGQEHSLRLALIEAEALAWETEFPHLVFPDLALEKVQSLASWRQRQSAVRNNNQPIHALAF